MSTNIMFRVLQEVLRTVLMVVLALASRLFACASLYKRRQDPSKDLYLLRRITGLGPNAKTCAEGWKIASIPMSASTSTSTACVNIFANDRRSERWPNQPFVVVRQEVGLSRSERWPNQPRPKQPFVVAGQEVGLNHSGHWPNQPRPKQPLQVGSDGRPCSRATAFKELDPPMQFGTKTKYYELVQGAAAPAQKTTVQRNAEGGTSKFGGPPEAGPTFTVASRGGEREQPSTKRRTPDAAAALEGPLPVLLGRSPRCGGGSWAKLLPNPQQEQHRQQQQPKPQQPEPQEQQQQQQQPQQPQQQEQELHSHQHSHQLQQSALQLMQAARPHVSSPAVPGESSMPGLQGGSLQPEQQQQQQQSQQQQLPQQSLQHMQAHVPMDVDGVEPIHLPMDVDDVEMVDPEDLMEVDYEAWSPTPMDIDRGSADLSMEVDG